MTRAAERGGARAVGHVRALGHVGAWRERDVREVEEGGEEAKQLRRVRRPDADAGERLQRRREGRRLGGGAVLEAAVLGRGQELEPLALGLADAAEQRVEDVVVALARPLRHHSRLLEQVGADGAADDGAVAREVRLHEFAEARRVVVAQRARVAERLEQRVRLQQLPLQHPARAVGAAAARRARRHLPRGGRVGEAPWARWRRWRRSRAARSGAHEVLEEALGRLGLAGARLARDEDRLVVAVLLEAGERRVGRRVQVRRQRADGLPAVALDLWGWGGCG